VAGDGFRDRDELTGGVAYDPDPRVNLRGECRLRRPDLSDRSDLLASLVGNVTLPGVRIENRLSLQDDLALFSADSGLDRLSDAGWRVSTSPTRRRAPVDARDREGARRRRATWPRCSSDHALKVMRKVSGRTAATAAATRADERRAGLTPARGSTDLRVTSSSRATTLDAEVPPPGPPPQIALGTELSVGCARDRVFSISLNNAFLSMKRRGRRRGASVEAEI
jgi:hypothetical protein